MNDYHMDVGQPDDGRMDAVRQRLYAYCFPNVPRTAEEQSAFEEAALLQYVHEETQRSLRGDLPESMEGFRIGDFQMTFAQGMSTGRLTARTVCPAAYGALLRHGLLYRGAEGR
ncbi:MAG: hypothetical protein IJ157_14185 [Clostridia bacterium]|nr:hypothetical protein [Clostridia bacterium]